MELWRFVLRGHALNLYRAYMRTIRGANESVRGAQMQTTRCRRFPSATFLTTFDPFVLVAVRSTGALRDQVRDSFKSQMDVKDNIQIKYLISDGRKTLKELEEMIKRSRG